MPEVKEEAKEETKLTEDQVLDKLEESRQETPSETSSEKEPEETKSEEPKAEETDLDKKGAEETKEEVPKEFHKHPAWQRIMKERDEARKALEEAPKESLSKDEIDEFRKTTSSPSYVRESMKAQGYTDEAIDTKLREMGHTVPERASDDMGMIAKGFGLTTDQLTPEEKQQLPIQTKLFDILFKDRMAKTLPNVLNPLQDTVSKITQTSTADKYMAEMKSIVDKKGILDFGKDIEPELNKWMDEHPEGVQEDLFAYFKDINSEKTIDRLEKGGKKKTRDETKNQLRGNKEGGVTNTQVKIGDKNVSDDQLLDAIGYKE